METIGPPGFYWNIELSPGGKQLALEQLRTDTTQSDIWTMDLRDGRMSQITNSGKAWGNSTPRWSPDGRQIAFSSNRDQVDSGESGENLYVSQIDSGMRRETLLVKNSQYKKPSDWWIGRKKPSDWSPDGRFFLYQNFGGTLTLLPLFGARKSENFIGSAIDGRFSPNGHWVAYTVAFLAIDGYVVYVRAFPRSEKKWQVSRGLAMYPLWRKDGKELFYVELAGKSKKLMSVEVKAGAGPDAPFEASPPRTLFELPTPGGVDFGQYLYAASPDGQSFYVFTQGAQQNLQAQVVLNWTELLPKK